LTGVKTGEAALDHDQGDLRRILLSLITRQAAGGRDRDERRRGDMAETRDSGQPGNPDPERIPFMQRVLDNPFLLLFLGVTIPTVFYILWGVMELTQVPLAG
jgi:hypothetical protein